MKKLLQDNKLMAAISDIAQHRFKRMDYNFDLVSGNVHRVDYQTGKADQWHHAYTYDADNRITDVYTSTNTPLLNPAYGQAAAQNEPTLTPYWDKEAGYKYYDHGPLARTELGAERVQGIDYVYTLQGWIKGVNSASLDPTRDPGKDASTAPANQVVGRDVFGFSLHYYEGDYKGIVSANESFIAAQSNSDLTANSSNLYNGNIARMVTTITHPDTREVLPLGNAYKYDQLQRLKEARSYTNLNTSTNTWGSGQAAKYLNTFSYDANGNITNQERRNENGALIDNLTYRYNKVNGKTVQNRLYHVDDTQANTAAFTDDIDDMGSLTLGQSVNTANNFQYDQEGRLIRDDQEGIASIEWRVDGKVKKINRTAGSVKKNLIFEYDAMGHRIAKHVLTSANVLEKSTFYVLDAQGNAMAVYERAVNASNQSVTFEHTEKMIYGSSRLGVLNCKINLLGSAGTAPYSQTNWTHKIGQRSYELSNHLGNVLSVVSDKPVPHPSSASGGGGTVEYYMADVMQSTDYSGFGVQLSGRNFLKANVSKDYRRGFQGQEEDDEIKGEGNSVNYKYRMHDPRLGRFFAVDPLASKYPHNSPYAFSENDVIGSLELEGLEKVKLFTVSFAPFTYFGFDFLGDGADRKFGDGFDNYRIAGTVYVDLSTGNSASMGHGSYSTQIIDAGTGQTETCYSEAQMDVDVQSSSKNNWKGKTHNYGGNCTVTAACDIDVYASYSLSYKPNSNPGTGGWLYVAGNSEGDKFPANEQYIMDGYGNKVMLGVSGIDSDWKNTAPFTELCFNGSNEKMSSFSLHILMDKDDKFTGVRFNDATYSIDEWNEKFTSLSPTNTSVNTSVDTIKGEFKTQ